MELIVKTGIADAIAKKLGKMKTQGGVAETIENNVRSKIIKEHLNDPSFYEKMSQLLDEVIKARKEEALEYEKYLKRIYEIVKLVEAGHGGEIPEALKKSAALRAIYNNLQSTKEVAEETDAAYEGDPNLALAIQIDETIRRVKPADFRGHKAKENEIKYALLPFFDNDQEEVNRIFDIISKQSEY